MVGVYIAKALGAVVLVALAVDNLPQELAGRSDNIKKEILELPVATFKHLRHPYMLFIIPLTMYSGFEQASFNAEFSKVRNGQKIDFDSTLEFWVTLLIILT